MVVKSERTKSEDYLHEKPERLNCAQSVLKGFQKELSIPDTEIEAYRVLGGGRAQDGVCGALYAAVQLVGESKKAELEQAFTAELGTVYCRELKRNKKACIDCVRLADRLVEKEIEGRR